MANSPGSPGLAELILTQAQLQADREYKRVAGSKKR